MFSEKDYFYGQRKYVKKFDKLSELASSFFGDITQCGIIEINKSGHVCWVANRPDFADAHFEHKRHLSDPLLVYADNLKAGLCTFDASQNLSFLYDSEEYFSKKLDILHGFYYTEKINNNTFRHYAFASSTPDIYKKIINNDSLIQPFIKYFKQETQDILNDVGEYKVNMAESGAKGDAYFYKPSNTEEAIKEQHIKLWHKMHLLDEHETLSDREFQCLVLYCKGYPSKLAGKKLNISYRSVEKHLENIKNKLNFSKKAELLDKTGQILLPS